MHGESKTIEVKILADTDRWEILKHMIVIRRFLNLSTHDHGLKYED